MILATLKYHFLKKILLNNEIIQDIFIVVKNKIRKETNLLP